MPPPPPPPPPPPDDPPPSEPPLEENPPELDDVEVVDADTALNAAIPVLKAATLKPSMLPEYQSGDVVP